MNNDTIKVAAGTYKESVVVSSLQNLTIQGGWNLTFSAYDPNTYVTLLSLNGASVGFSCQETVGLTIDGFHIENYVQGHICPKQVLPGTVPSRRPGYEER